MRGGSFVSVAVLGGLYFVLASAAAGLTRFDGGVAFLWPAGALLIATLFTWPRSRWPQALLACSLASSLATGLFGLGWPMALPFVLINLTEALVAARLMQPLRRDKTALGSTGWLVRFILAAGIFAPLVGAVMAGAFGTMIGLEPIGNALRFFAGHSLGNLTLVPFVLLIIDRRSGRAVSLPPGRNRHEASLLLALVAAVTLATFWQTSQPLLFIPFMPVMFATFRLGRLGAIVSLVLVASIGGILTLIGHGPIQLIASDPGTKVQFLQFYLATLCLTALPAAAELRHRAELFRRLSESEQRYRMIAEHSSDIVMQLSIDGRLTYVSPAIAHIGGYDPHYLIGRDVRAMIAPIDVPTVQRMHAAVVANPGRSFSFEYRGITRSGERRWFESRVRAMKDSEGKVVATLSVIRDINERKVAEQTLTQAAMTDALTGLPNRRAFFEAAAKASARASGDGPHCVAVIDLDHFKRVNDVHGHDAGDAVLRQFAVQANALMRSGDTCARLGGEEFALLLPGTSLSEAVAICDRLRQAIAEMGVPTASGMVRVTMSGGVAELNAEGLDDALKRADLALYQAKAGGRDQLALAA